MKHIALIFCLIFSSTSPNQLPKEREEQVSELQKEGCNLIDAIFANAKTSIQAREELMNAAWWSKQKEIKELRNLQSDATIIFTFDENRKNPIPQKLATYVEQKINEEIPLIY